MAAFNAGVLMALSWYLEFRLSLFLLGMQLSPSQAIARMLESRQCRHFG